MFRYDQYGIMEKKRQWCNSTYHTASLFSGAGGLDLGFAQSGHFIGEFALEKLHAPVVTFSNNFYFSNARVGEVAALPAIFEGNIEDFVFTDLELKNIALVMGGPPCQDFSVVRGPSSVRLGIEVKRGRLYLEFIRALMELAPALFVFENVPGLQSSNQGAALKAIQKDFADCGYSVLFADVLDSADFGVPQRRRRLIIIGAQRDYLSPQKTNTVQSLFLSRLKRPEANFRTYPLTPIEVFEGEVLSDLAEKYSSVMAEYSGLLGKQNWDIFDDYQRINGMGQLSDPRVLENALEGHRAILMEMEWLHKPVLSLKLKDRSTELLKESDNVLERMCYIMPNGNHEQVRGTKYQVEGRGISLIYRRLHPLKPSYTVVAYGGGGTWGYHYERGRGKLTHRERARLQTFPDWFLFKGGSQEIRAQIGEAVPPLLAKRIASACAEALAELNI